ncbi:hypothetical protein Slin15195_G020720 [Septoria linicola]|uniref:Uncharacterized protein n=1 Tax=Septoria linicola TaxID=215465 RepID=A0A9Q9EGY5_9PEZI|nr:hypothetical protein Slin15195_G020720 [Septoria linicola]
MASISGTLRVEPLSGQQKVKFRGHRPRLTAQNPEACTQASTKFTSSIAYNSTKSLERSSNRSKMRPHEMIRHGIADAALESKQPSAKAKSSTQRGHVLVWRDMCGRRQQIVIPAWVKEQQEQNCACTVCKPRTASDSGWLNSLKKWLPWPGNSSKDAEKKDEGEMEVEMQEIKSPITNEKERDG